MRQGLPFLPQASDCFNYYQFDSNNKVAEVEAIGLVETQGDKSVTDKIKIVREIPWQELLEIVNMGKGCTGLCNTGNMNTGNMNTGNMNTGNMNTGDMNTGDWNSTNYSTGFFNSEQQPIYMFNKPTNMQRDDIGNLAGIQILKWNFENSWWIHFKNMSEEEKTEHPEHKTAGGYLKTVDFKTACELMWAKLSDNEKSAVMQLPNFDATVFEEITGINVKE